jgi:predicted enzyme related to lactoylglutathione lyase
MIARMSERTSHKPGTFSWVDLSTSDAEAAKAFYGALFGWEFEDMPVGEGMTYTMARKGGKDVAALSQGDEPPHWNNYVTVESADDAAARAEELGGTVLAPAFDVLDSGRMAVVQDPTGAILAVWEPRAHIGAERVNETGAFTWNDLSTPDIAKAASFYGDWFGWRTEEIPGAQGLRVIYNGDRTNGSISSAVEGMPPFWCPYFGTDDLEPAMARTTELGGRILAGPIPVPQGAFAVAQDPQGAVFALWGGSYDD